MGGQQFEDFFDALINAPIDRLDFEFVVLRQVVFLEEDGLINDKSINNWNYIIHTWLTPVKSLISPFLAFS